MFTIFTCSFAMPRKVRSSETEYFFSNSLPPYWIIFMRDFVEAGPDLTIRNELFSSEELTKIVKGKMPSDIEKAFINSVIRFLREQTVKVNSDAAESLEVAIQCIEAAYEVPTAESNAEDSTTGDEAAGESPNASHLENINVFELFQTAAINATPDRKEKAEEMKNSGNHLMREGKHYEALLMYNRAINYDATNPVFYCNRAAAYIRLYEYDRAINDCRMALLYNPNYGKAYGRMGTAYSNMLKYDEALAAYKRALQIEPNNPDYQNNLRLCEDRLHNQTPADNEQIRQQLLQNFASDNPMFRQLINTVMSNPLFSAASRQLVSEITTEYPDFISGVRQQLMNCGPANSAASDQTGNQSAPNPSSNVASQQSQQSENQQNNPNPQQSAPNNGFGFEEFCQFHELEDRLADFITLHQGQQPQQSQQPQQPQQPQQSQQPQAADQDELLILDFEPIDDEPNPRPRDEN